MVWRSFGIIIISKNLSPWQQTINLYGSQANSQERQPSFFVPLSYASEPGFAGDISAIEIWLIDKLNSQPRFSAILWLPECAHCPA